MGRVGHRREGRAGRRVVGARLGGEEEIRRELHLGLEGGAVLRGGRGPGGRRRRTAGLIRFESRNGRARSGAARIALAWHMK